MTEQTKTGHFPSWLHRKLPISGAVQPTNQILEKYRLNTVCEEAKCPNRIECYSRKTATFLALGKECSRNCGFCDIDFNKKPVAPEEDEPERIAKSVEDLGLKHVVITMVARDDLADGGANHLARIIIAVRQHNPHCSVEVLTSDFAGNFSSLDIVLNQKPEIFNHNIETVRRLSPRVRHKANYDRTLSILSHAKASGSAKYIKSGLMVGLGEKDEEVQETLNDLRKAGCDAVTIGQYLRPSKRKLLVQSFVHPDKFASYAKFGYSLGLKFVYSAPMVRSSYNAQAVLHEIDRK